MSTGSWASPNVTVGGAFRSGRKPGHCYTFSVELRSYYHPQRQLMSGFLLPDNDLRSSPNSIFSRANVRTLGLLHETGHFPTRKSSATKMRPAPHFRDVRSFSTLTVRATTAAATGSSGIGAGAGISVLGSSSMRRGPAPEGVRWQEGCSSRWSCSTVLSTQDGVSHGDMGIKMMLINR